MHFSDDPNNFRNERYLAECDAEFKNMFRAYHKYIAYRNKLRNELTMSDEQRAELHEIDVRFTKNVRRAYKRIQQDDFIEPQEPSTATDQNAEKGKWDGI